MIYEVKIGKVVAHVKHDGDAASLRETFRCNAIGCSTAYYAQEGDYVSPMFVVGGFYFDFRWFFDADFQYIEPEITEYPYGNPWDWAIERDGVKNWMSGNCQRIDGPVA